MKESLTFHGLSWRVNLRVFDFEEDELAARKVGWKPKEIKPTKFVVSALPVEAKRFTAFSCGKQLYYGESLTAALLHVRMYAELEPQLPKSWNKYKAREAVTASGMLEDAAFMAKIGKNSEVAKAIHRAAQPEER